MDLVTLTVGLPFAPLKGVFAIARVLQEEAERELYDPSRVRREVEEIEAAQAEGSIPDDVAEERKQAALNRLVESG